MLPEPALPLITDNQREHATRRDALPSQGALHVPLSASSGTTASITMPAGTPKANEHEIIRRFQGTRWQVKPPARLAADAASANNTDAHPIEVKNNSRAVLARPTQPEQPA